MIGQHDEHEAETALREQGYRVEQYDQEIYPVAVYKAGESGRFWTCRAAWRCLTVHGRIY